MTAEKSEQRYHCRRQEQRPVSPVKQQQGEKQHHIHHTVYAGQRRFSRVQKQQAHQSGEHRAHNCKFLLAHIFDIVEKHVVIEICQHNGIYHSQKADADSEPFIGNDRHKFIHTDIAPFVFIVG